MRGELRWSVCDDPAFLALLDLGTYAPSLPDWDFAGITSKMVTAMNARQLMAWGNPEVPLNVNVTDKQPKTRARVHATAKGVIETSGSLCLAGYTSLTTCAESAKEKFPQRKDLAFRVAPGIYEVTVHRLFAHGDGEQFPELEELPEGDHYVVVLELTAKPPRRKHKRVPWALRPR